MKLSASLKRPLAIGVLTLVCVSLAALVWFAAQRDSRPLQLQSLRVAGPILVTTALHQIADARGLWAEQGLAVEFIQTVTGKQAMELALENKADIAYVAETPFVTDALQGGSIAALAMISEEAGSVKIVGRRDRGIQAPADLAGKRVGVAQGTSADYFLWAYLIGQKIDPNSVRKVHVAPDGMAGQLQRDAIDAVSVWEPYSGLIERELGSNGIAMEDVHVYLLTLIASARSEWIGKNGPVVQKYLRALLAAEVFLRERPEQARRIVAERMGVAPETLDSSWRNNSFRVTLTQAHLIALENVVHWAREAGLHSPVQQVNMLRHLSVDGLLAVAPARVTVIH